MLGGDQIQRSGALIIKEVIASSPTFEKYRDVYLLLVRLSRWKNDGDIVIPLGGYGSPMITLHPGQAVVTSRMLDLKLDNRWSRQKVRTALRVLEEEGFISIKTDPKHPHYPSIVTIHEKVTEEFWQEVLFEGRMFRELHKEE